MKTVFQLLSLFLACGCGQYAFGQALANHSPVGGEILGYLDPATGAFRLAAPPEAEIAPAATATLTGKFVFNFTINIQTSLPTTALFACGATAIVGDGTSGSHQESNAASVVRSGSTATCSVAIPYSWVLANASSDVVTLSYTLTAVAGGINERICSRSLAPIKVPANGVVTTQAFSVVI